MDTKIENAKGFLLWASAIFVVVLIILGFSLVGYLSDAGTTQNVVSFSGQGTVYAVPDVAIVRLSIVTEADTSEDAQEENSEKSQDVIDYLKSKDIDKEDIKTTGYNIYPKYGSDEAVGRGGGGSAEIYPYLPQPVSQSIVGYTVTESIEVKIRDLDIVSEILDGVVDEGANRVDSFRFDIDDPDELQAEARELAIEDAKKKARELEDQVGLDLGKIVNFNEGYMGYPMYDSAVYMEAGRGGGGSMPSIEPGENEVTVNVTLTYQIK
ncbi:MAG: SIMPL domain-containing protein [Parcubacteria group bacterium]